jgi:hypothetical protein
VREGSASGLTDRGNATRLHELEKPKEPGGPERAFLDTRGAISQRAACFVGPCRVERHDIPQDHVNRVDRSGEERVPQDGRGVLRACE